VTSSDVAPSGTPTAAPTRPPTRAETERAGGLPRPGRERWQPLRVGLLDLFHYDYEEFWFRDGRLLWRGNNGTGKSKVLALTLPFLLDGEASAHRVEPDGDQHKRMEWNLLLGGRYPERLGYTWIEFGRADADGTEHYVTAGIALKAVAGRGIADRWFFVTDRRVGDDLPLLTAGGAALTRDRLTEVIGDRGQVVRTAEHYRRLLDERLFQLGADRYGALLDLLIQLRQPQLSKRPDPVMLSRALSEALTPLDSGLLADAAAGFHDLEQQRLELQSLQETGDHVERFLTRYSRYAGVAARRYARDLRGAQSSYEEAGRQLGEVRQQAEQARSDHDATATRLEEVRREQTRLQAVREQLTERPELHDLDRARTEAAAARLRSEAASQRLTGATDRHRRSSAKVDATRAAASEATEQRDRSVASLAAAADEAAARAAHDHALATPGVFDDAAALRRALGTVADDRTAALTQVRTLTRAAIAADGRLTEQRTRLTQQEADRDAAAEALTEADEGLTLEGERLLGAWMGFAARADALDVPYPDEVGLPEWVTTLDGPDPATAELDERVRTLRRDLAHRDAAAQTQLTEIDRRIGELTVQQAELEAGIPPSPPASLTRDVASRATRPGAPLWRAVDVRGDLLDAGRAGIEAALEASGLLDAWLTPDGGVLDPDQLDAVLLTGLTGPDGVTGPDGLTGPPSAHERADGAPDTLADLLRPTIDRDDSQAAALTEAAVDAVLRAVRVHPDAETLTHAADRCAVSLDGGYRLGTLQGRWSKPVSEYLGAAAREQARRSRLAQLAAELDIAEADRARVEAVVADVARLDARVTEQLGERPSDQPLRDAHARVGAAALELQRREAALGPTRQAVEAARAAAELARQELAGTAADLGLPTDPTAQDAVAAALARFREECSDLVAAVQRCTDRAQEVVTWQSEVDAGQEALTAATEEAVTADDEHRAADAGWHTLQDSLGDTVEELTAHLDRTVAALAELTAEHKDVERRHLEARDRLNLAAGKQEVLVIEQSHRQDRRDRAVSGLRSFAATGLLAVAAPELEIPDPGEQWAADPAVRLARRAEATLSEVDDSDQAWKRVQDDITRRFSELTEALTRHSHQAHADLRDGLYVVSILYSGRERAPQELIRLISTEVELRERELTTREQQVLEEHLVGDVASRLQELITEADAMVGWMNAELAERPTSTGMRLRLAWQPDPDGPEGLAQARGHLLRQTSQLWSAADRRAVGDFLQRQIQRMRAEDPQGTWTEHLRRALDYRGWHRFVIERLQDGNWRSAIGPASGGERVLTVSLPLFAAASAHYRSAHPHAPRLVLLDEAFAGVDDDSRAKCLGLLTQFDLDVAMTSEREWGFYATVPGIATYQLVRHDGVDAVHVSGWEWDGVSPRQVPRSTTLPIQTPDASRSPRGGPRDGDPDAEALF
jgi:uncharacterized protein (TIGR02680 family)